MSLIERLQNAEHGGPELDAWVYAKGRAVKINVHTDKFRAEVFYEAVDDAGGQIWLLGEADIPEYTTSLDAALTLVPEGWEWCLNSSRVGNVVSLCSRWSDDNAPVFWSSRPDESETGRRYNRRIGTSSTPALALCIAAMKARSET